MDIKKSILVLVKWFAFAIVLSAIIDALSDIGDASRNILGGIGGGYHKTAKVAIIFYTLFGAAIDYLKITTKEK